MNNDNVVHEEQYEELTIKIVLDDDPGMNPVEDWDMLGKQVYWHRRMNLGHCWKETNKYDPMEWLQREVYSYAEDSQQYKDWKNVEDELAKFWRKDADVDCWLEDNTTMSELLKLFSTKNLVIPVQAYEHGGITISASDRRAGWESFDSGQLGFVYVSHEDILKEFSRKKISKKLLEQAEKILLAEVSEYDSYLTGEVFGFIVEDGNGEQLESCWGFIGNYRKGCLEDAQSSAKFLWSEILKERKLLDNRMKV